MTGTSPAPAPAWPSAAATGVGSWPGTDVREALRVVLGELPGLPHLPELPARGAGADMVGRTLALLPDLAAETVPTGWRVARAAGPDLRRARSWLGEDLDALEELAAGVDGPLKAQLTGPVTLAAAVELPGGERAVRDHGARRDLADALAEAAVQHVDELRRRLPGARVVLQLDEPALPAVLAGRVPTASGYGTLRAVDPAEARTHLRTVLGAVAATGAVPVVHCCAAEPPVALLREAGVRGLSLDSARLGPRDDDALGEAVEDGVQLLLGVVPTDGAGASDPAATVASVVQQWRRLGFPLEGTASDGTSTALADRVVLTPACGLGRSTPPVARDVLARTRAAARLLADPPDAGTGER